MTAIRRPARLRRTFWLVVGAVALVHSPLAYAAPIERCLEQVRAGRFDANADLCRACPELATAIRRQSLSPVLDKPLACPLKLAEVADIVAFRVDMARTPSAEAPSPAALAPILQDLSLKIKPEPEGWWDRLRRWFKKWLADDEGSLPPWLEDWLKSLSVPDWFGDVLFKALLLLIVILAAVIIFNELRALRWRGRLRHAHVGGAGEYRPDPVAERTLADIRAMPLGAQAGALLRYVIVQLVQAGYLPDRRDQTNLELTKTLGQHEPALAGRFGHLVTDVERAVYGKRQLDQSMATTLWHNAEIVLAGCAAMGKEDIR